MGLIRLLLAVSVVEAHTMRNVGVGGRMAVEMFYIISGFLISYLVVERRAYPTTRAFWTSRFLRLYPTYLVVAVGALLLAWLTFSTGDGSQVLETYAAAPAGPRAFLTFTNATLVGQDWTMFMGVHDGTWTFVTDFRDSSPQLWKGLLVPPAWSLGVEMGFYLVAPWLLRSRKAIYWTLGGSLGVRAVLVALGYGAADPWTYRFFPAELWLFLVGALAHQVLRPWWKRRGGERLGHWSRGAVVAVGVVLLVAAYAPIPFLARELAMLALLAATLPLLFAFRPRGSWDRFIGELSYPLYLCHYPLMLALIPLVEHFGFAKRSWELFVVVLVVSLAVSVALTRWVVEPVDRLRHRLRAPAA